NLELILSVQIQGMHTHSRSGRDTGRIYDVARVAQFKHEGEAVGNPVESQPAARAAERGVGGILNDKREPASAGNRARAHREADVSGEVGDIDLGVTKNASCLVLSSIGKGSR